MEKNKLIKDKIATETTFRTLETTNCCSANALQIFQNHFSERPEQKPHDWLLRRSLWIGTFNNGIGDDQVKTNRQAMHKNAS